MVDIVDKIKIYNFLNFINPDKLFFTKYTFVKTHNSKTISYQVLETLLVQTPTDLGKSLDLFLNLKR